MVAAGTRSSYRVWFIGHDSAPCGLTMVHHSRYCSDPPVHLSIPRLIEKKNRLKAAPLGVTSQISLEIVTEAPTSTPPELVAPVAVPRCSAAHLTAARRPFGTSTANQITRLAQVQRRNKNGKPSQLFPDLLMIAWITFGPIIDDEVFDSP